GEPKVHGGKLRVWAYGDCESAHPVTGNLLEEVGAERYGREPAGDYRNGNLYRNGRDGVVTLAGARNEILAFQLLLDSTAPQLKGVKVQAGALTGPESFEIPADNVSLFRQWYVKQNDWMSEICIPLQSGKKISIPNADNKVPGQRNQSIMVDLWVPKQAPPGKYRGEIMVSADGVAPFAVPVELEVWPIELPDKLSFNCELNAYSVAAITKDRGLFRLAHAHRTTLNVLPYSQTGTVKTVYDLPLAGAGKAMHVTDWTKYDEDIGPLLDGSAFKDMPRAGVPLASQYLPFFENWPLPFREHYAFKSTDRQEHSLTAGPIEELMDEQYADGFKAVVKDFVRHFREKGWKSTNMEFYLNNKPNFTKGALGFWCLDEPQNRDDFLAIRYWGRLFKDAAADAKDVRFIFRGDISRPHRERNWFTGLMDLLCASSAFRTKNVRCREMMRSGMTFYNYGSLNPVAVTNLNAEAWPVNTYLLNGDGLLPWNTIGKVANYRAASTTAILLPPSHGARKGQWVCSARLKALRRGQQDVEYMALLAREKGYDREQIAALLKGLIDLKGKTYERFLDEAGETVFKNLSSERFAQMRAAIAAALGSTWKDKGGRPAIGAGGRIGCGENPTVVKRLTITKSGVYENYLVDGAGGTERRNLVSIKADDVILRNCTIRNGRHNAIVVYAKNVLIDSCKIHHMLAGTFEKQNDAHGITGAPHNLVIRNCDISYVSGDSVQFSPDRRPWNDVLIENCTFWTGLLPADAGGFKKGEKPGENALDTKQKTTNPRSRITLRNSLFYGWGGGQVSIGAALNLKHHIAATVENCVLRDNVYCFRLRGPTTGWSKKWGGAVVKISDCAVYNSRIVARMENNIPNLKIRNLLFGEGITTKYTGRPGPGYENTGSGPAPPYEQAIALGLK
ncbi:MAG: right-handed parallel beta-helix repeat-containing protein, partial [Planctomycetes bacterium]|nr:right-handed parallel beta-helix repeat-containing protein [Planctomycetota bacterium]